MNTKEYCGYKITKDFRMATVWVFQAKDKRLIGTHTRKMNSGLTPDVCRAEIKKFLLLFGIKL